MKIQEIFTESLGTLFLNKSRTVLAILGIIIGIASVISLMSLGLATQKSVQNQIQSLGSNLLTVQPGASQSNGGVRGAVGSRSTLTLEDAQALIKANLEKVKQVSPETSGRGQIVASGSNSNSQVLGVTPVYGEVHKVEVSEGSFISQNDVDSMRKVVVLGPTLATSLFPDGSDPVGKSVRINNQNLTIIGVTVAKGGSGFNNPDDMAYVPLSTAQKQIFGQNYLNSISIEVDDSKNMNSARDTIGYFLLERHKISDPSQADFMIMSQEDMISTVAATTSSFTNLLSGVAAISLIVGGIGIMNIMLVSVTERTREIGLRKAIGARQSDILFQFIVESSVLSCVGGILGIIFGAVSAQLIGKYTQWVTKTSLGSIIISFGVSLAVGLFFGIVPARRASKLDPITALRYE